jgi:integrase/recombinase XerD
MTDLRRASVDYLALRRSLGFKLVSSGHLLSSFVAFAEQAGESTITIELAVRWATAPTDADPSYVRERLSVVRTFAKHMAAFDPATEVPAADLVGASGRRARPYPYSDDDISALMTHARTLRPPLRGATLGVLIGLLAVTGMRVGEAIAADRDDLCVADGVLVVRDAKFHKSRELPLAPSTVRALRAYQELREKLCPKPMTGALLVCHHGRRLAYKNIHYGFSAAVRCAGLGGDVEPSRGGGRCRPRIHDLRHHFAVATLRDWYRQGCDVERKLPLLSTYLGHVNPAATYWYLEATPDLMGLVADRLEIALGDLP